jgi:hypothetical protein
MNQDCAVARTGLKLNLNATPITSLEKNLHLCPVQRNRPKEIK